MRHLLYLLLLLTLGCTAKKAGKLPENPTPPVVDPVEEVTEIPPVENPPETIPEKEMVPPYLVAVLQKTACYGKCPVFEARMFSNGHLTFHGIEDLSLLGYYEAWATSEMLNQIKTEAYRIGFFDFAEAYPSNGHPLDDLPMTITYLNFDNREKTIIDNYDSPLQLRRFEQFLEKLFENVDWQKMDGTSLQD